VTEIVFEVALHDPIVVVAPGGKLIAMLLLMTPLVVESAVPSPLAIPGALDVASGRRATATVPEVILFALVVSITADGAIPVSFFVTPLCMIGT